MARPVSSTALVTVNRFHGGLELPNYLQVGDGNTVEFDGPVDVAGVTCHLVAGTRTNDNPLWVRHTNSAASVELNLYGSTPFAALLIPIGEWVFSLTWGAGRYLLDSNLLDDGFGLLFAIRRLNAARLRMLNSSSLDIKARNTRTSFPGGSSIAGFSMALIGELVSSAAGPADLTGLTYHEETGRQYSIRAGTSLSLPIGKSPEAVLADLRAICAIVAEDDDHSPLRFISQIRPLNDAHPDLRELENRLIGALGGDVQHGPLALAWPSELMYEIEEANSFLAANVNESGRLVLEPGFEIGELTEHFALLPPVLRVARLDDGRVVPCVDEYGKEPLARATPVRKWLAFETVIDHRTYCFHQGRWYEIGKEAVNRVREQVAELLANKSSLTFPLWTPTGKQDDEHQYCRQVAKQSGYLVLDRSFAKTAMHPKFELADVFGPDNEIVHIKWMGGAPAASHLFTQAEMSAWSQREEPEAVQQLHAKVNKLDSTRSITERPRIVVLAIAGRQWNVNQLFTLSQVGLLRLNLSLLSMGVKLEFADIPFVPKTRAAKNRGTAGGQAA